MLFQVMRTHGFNPSEEDLRDMIRNVDKNANGAIDFNEFIEMMLKQGEDSFLAIEIRVNSISMSLYRESLRIENV